MKEDKICVDKQKGIILIAIFIIVVFTFLSNYLSKLSTSTSTRASVPKTNIQPKSALPIIGGDFAADGEFPFHTLLIGKYALPFCGGTLISKDWIITAAHCVDKVQNNPTSVSVIIGLDHLDKDLKAFHYSKIDKIILHKDYNFSNNVFLQHSDIALLHLAEPTKGIPTLSLFNPGKGDLLEYIGAQLSADIKATIIGFGMTLRTGFGNGRFANDSKLSSDLKKFKAVIQKPDFYDYSERFSLYAPNGKVAAGDSGSPAVYTYKGITYLLGICSYSSDLSPNTFTSASYFFPWIFSETGISENSGTYQIPIYIKDEKLMKLEKYAITICSEATTMEKCDERTYLCSWDSSTNRCINDPKSKNVIIHDN